MTYQAVNKSKHVDNKLLEKVATEVFSYLKNEFEVNLKFVTLSEIKDLNLRYRGFHMPTNVLSFNKDTDSRDGDIVICEEVVGDEAEAHGMKTEDFMALYLAHGMLHLAGYDHQNEVERDKMEAIEHQILSNVGINISR